MRIIFARQPFPKHCRKTIFLAGPSPRGDKETGKPNVPSWRPAALNILQTKGYDGDVYVPEPGNGRWSADDYDEQFAWENEGLHRADQIVFWVPRDMATLPGFTTNHEHGQWFRSGKTVLGAPSFKDTPKICYLMRKGGLVGQPQAEKLDEVIALALKNIGNGAFRSGGETCIPLHIWRTSTFQHWYHVLLACEGRLDRATVEWSSGSQKNEEPHAKWVLEADVRMSSGAEFERRKIVSSV